MKLFQLIFIFLFLDGNTKCEEQSNNLLLQSRAGHVTNETFVYLYIHYLGNIALSLNSIAGDADLYISDTNLTPTYDVDSYDLHSATCGVDFIEIPENFGSPISVGIYGHPSYETSYFTLEVMKRSPFNSESLFVIIDDEIPKSDKKKDTISNTKKSKFRKDNEKASNNWSGIISLFEVFQLIFL